jgi:predicted DNA-binding transcriptional regulator YafY
MTPATYTVVDVVIQFDMDKKMSETLVRQWTMLKMLPRSPRRIDTASIQNRLRDDGFVVSLRTIQRDLQLLSVVFPLECDERDKPFGWHWMRDAESYGLPGMSPQKAVVNFK